jgi:acyl-CoA reductase-like NAD-dependent aldehyde dehydrogenase
MIALAEEALARVEVPAKNGFRRFIERRPVGPVLVIGAWNYPYLIAVNSVVPALLAGNPVILKHSEQTPLCAVRWARSFAAVGLPEGVFAVIHVDHPTVAKVVADRRLGFVAFTGSVAGGRAVEKAAAGAFVGMGLELGGKDPAYVRADADLDFAVANLVDGSFFNAGQSCCAIERIYVERPLYDDFVEKFLAETRRSQTLGNPLEAATTLGPVVRSAAAVNIASHVEAALREGAKALLPLHDPQRYPYFPPQVLVDVDHGMAVMREETFGPVAAIMAVESDEHAVFLMNDSPYGLTASIWTTDAEAALRLGDQVETGTWFMNRCDYLDPALAWTGVKDSGRGCSLSQLGFEQLTRPKSYHLRLEL